MSQTFTVRFLSEELSEPQYIGPFYSEDDANDYADEENYRLSLAGIPSSVASYSVLWIMKLSKDQTKQLAAAYCEKIVDDMDLDTLMTMCYDLLMDSYENMDPDDIKEEILDLYDEETLNSLMEEVQWLRLHFVMVIPGQSLMLTMKKMVTLMIVSLLKIMNKENTIEVIGMSQFMIVNTGDCNCSL